jgi:drug/metabolite transporter superfamily protein YnfA
MNHETLVQLFYLQGACLVLLIACFASWFWLRETRTGDWVCAIAATISAGLLTLSSWAMGSLGCLGGIFGFPSLIVYLWFMALWTSRRHQAHLRQWGKARGYKVISVERRWEANSRSGSIRSRAEYRITARRRSDGQFLIGWAFPTLLGFDVIWDPIPTRHVGTGLHVPNPPHAGPPDASKE